MNHQLYFLFLLLILTQGFITFDSGIINKDYSLDANFNCRLGNFYTYTFAFSGEFETTPQVFLLQENMDQGNDNLLMKFSITSITNTNFVIRIECINNWVYRFNLKWLAYDDTRVEIISCFDWTTFGQQTISHKNSDTIKGFPSIISLSYNGAFSIDITIDSITSTSVTFTITQTGGLVNVGFQILLIIEEGFSFVDRLQKSSDYTSSILTIQNNFSLVVAYVGFNFINTSFIREYKQYITTSTTIQYKLLHNFIKTQNTHYAAWIATVFTKEFKAMEASRIILAQYYDSNENRPFNQVNIQELNIQFNSINSNHLLVDKSINTINIEIINVCNLGKKFVSSFNICNCEGQQKKKQITKICAPMQNTLANRFRLINSQASNKEFYITLSSTGVQIKQVLYNQKKTEQILVEIIETDQ